MPIDALVSFLQIVSIIGSGFVAIKLFTSGLYRRYRIFSVYFLFRVPYLGAFWFLSRQGTNSATYFWIFIITEPIVMLFYILMVIELYRLVLERYKGLYTLGRWAMFLAMGISVLISVLTLLPKIVPSMPEPSRNIFKELAVERGVDLSLLLFIVLIVLFLGRYPIPLSRNVIVHTGIYALYFLSSVLGLLLRLLFTVKVSEGVNTFLAAITAACSIAWWLLLSAKGEQIQVHTPQLRPVSEERILQQLEAFNATLLKVSRK